MEFLSVGKSFSRKDGVGKATGKAIFSVDVKLPGMLHGKMLRSFLPHARVLHIDTSRAKRLLGVRAVITAKDLKGIRYAFVDTPRYPADEYPLAVEKVRYIGDEVASVAALDEEWASEALELIKVEYEELPAVFHPEEAMKPEAPILHGGSYEGASIWEDWGVKRGSPSRASYEENNLSGKTEVSLGDVEQGFRESDYIRQDRFQTQATAHGALEPHAILASFEPEGKLHLWLSSMGVFYKRYILARVLGLPLNRVRILKTYVGGAFGGKIDLFSYEFCAAFLSRKTGKPVRMECTREEVFYATRQRHPMIIHIKTGIKKDGTLKAQDIRVIVDNGAYRGTGAVVIFLAHIFNVPVYRVSHYRYKGYSVYTNNPVRGPQRGHGAPQIRFAVDSQLDIMAKDLDLDLVQIMLKNARQKGEVLPNEDRLNSCGLSQCIKKVSDAIGWDKRRKVPYRGIGISACAMFSGAPFYPFTSAALVELHPDGGAILFTGATEMGQGSDTTLSQIVSEVLGLPLEDIQVVSGDTELTPIDFGNFLSGGAFITGNAVREAALDARRQLLEVASDLLEVVLEDMVMENRKIYVKGSPQKEIPISKVIEASIFKNNGNPVIGRGYYKAIPGIDHYSSLAKARGRFTQAYAFSASAVEVEVDEETGKVILHRIVTSHDCGFALNPTIVEGQIQGNVSMGIGQALSEEVILERGLVFNPSFFSYPLPEATSTPFIHGSPVETHDAGGPFGAKEAGEGSLAGILASVANAIYDAAGIRISNLPITPEKVLETLEVS